MGNNSLDIQYGYSQASEEWDEVQARQLAFDLETAYNEFNKFLHSSWSTYIFFIQGTSIIRW